MSIKKQSDKHTKEFEEMREITASLGKDSLNLEIFKEGRKLAILKIVTTGFFEPLQKILRSGEE